MTWKEMYEMTHITTYGWRYESGNDPCSWYFFQVLFQPPRLFIQLRGSLSAVGNMSHFTKTQKSRNIRRKGALSETHSLYWSVIKKCLIPAAQSWDFTRGNTSVLISYILFSCFTYKSEVQLARQRLVDTKWRETRWVFHTIAEPQNSWVEVCPLLLA